GGGRMLFLGLGTGLGSALVWEKTLLPLELGDLPYPEGKIIEDYLGVPGLELLGEREWKREVIYAVKQLQRSFIADYVVLGGGNVHRFNTLPKGIEKGQNENAFLGGARLWETKEHSRQVKWPYLRQLATRGLCPMRMQRQGRAKKKLKKELARMNWWCYS